MGKEWVDKRKLYTTADRFEDMNKPNTAELFLCNNKEHSYTVVGNKRVFCCTIHAKQFCTKEIVEKRKERK